MVILLILLLSLTTVAAQTLTVLDLLRGSSEHTAFVAALERINGGSERLSSSNETVVVFAPDNTAISKLGEDTLSRLLSEEWKTHLEDLVMYHMVEGGVFDAVIRDRMTTVPTLQGDSLTISEGHPFLQVNAIDLFADAVMADNGAVYFTKHVFLPKSMTEHAASRLFNDTANFSTLHELSKLSGILSSLEKVAGPLTLFAPTNAAFDRMDQALLASLKHPNQKADLLLLLAYHVLWEENEPSFDLRTNADEDRSKVELSMMQGGNITVTSLGSNILLNNNSTLIEADVLVKNGIVHVVDYVLFPTDYEIKPKTLQSSDTTASKPDEASKSLTIVAIGESYIAGNGARAADGSRNYEDTTCYRSVTSWVGQYATCLENVAPGGEIVDVTFINRACSGARFVDVYATQLAGITKEVDLVLLSISGTDADLFAGMPDQCLLLIDPENCRESISASARLLPAIGIELVTLLTDIRSNARNDTRVVLTGYPYTSLDIEDFPTVRELRALFDLVEDMQIKAVEQANHNEGTKFVSFVSTKDLFAGHELDPLRIDALNSESWILGYNPGETLGYPEENFHYNALGHSNLGSYMCTNFSDFGAGHGISDPSDEDLKPALLAAILCFFIVTLVVFAVAFYLRSSREDSGDECSNFSRLWSSKVVFVQFPIKRAMLTVTRLAAVNPKACVGSCVLLSIGMLVAGSLTNFTLESAQDALWTPIGSRVKSHGDWTKSWTGSADGEHAISNVLLTLVLHRNGGNMVTREGVQKNFDVIDAIRTTSGYDDFCAEFGTESVCPDGSEYICQLYDIPRDMANVCGIVGPTGFWFHNRTLFKQQVASDEEAGQGMSLDIFLGEEGQFNSKDVFGYPEYADGILVSSTAFLSLVSLPKNNHVESLRRRIVEQLHDFQSDWMEDSTNPYHLEFFTTGSFSDEFERSIAEDISLLPGVFLVMVVFTCLAFSKRSWVRSRSLLGFGAVVCVLLSVMTGYGLLFLIGIPLTSLTQLLPFIMFGIGLDDSFILFNAYERTDVSKDVVARIHDTVDAVGVSIFMTTATSAAAFALGCVSSIPAVRWLCLFGSPTIVIDFLYQITFFVALIALDEQRMKASRLDCVACFTAKPRAEQSTILQQSHEPQMIEKAITWYSNRLLLPWVKAFVLSAFSGLFIACAIATTHLELEFDFTSVLPADSYVISFTDALNEFSHRRISVYVYFRNLDQGDASVQGRMETYVNELVATDAIADQPFRFWLRDYRDYALEFGLLELPFNESLRIFLDSPEYDYANSLMLDDQGSIVASRTQIDLGNLDVEDGVQVLAALQDQKGVSSDQPDNQNVPEFSFFTFNTVFYLWEFLIQTESELRLTTIVGICSVSAMGLLFLPHWSGVLLVGPTIVILYVDLLGILQFAGININGVSYVAIVMSIGLLVDFIMHIVLAYLESSQSDREAKVKATLKTMGKSVLLGGLSTFFGTLPLAFTSSEVFRTVFVAFVAIVALGLSHGLILLPVVLSMVGPTHVCLPSAEDLAQPPAEISRNNSNRSGNFVEVTGAATTEV